ncbi:MAG: TauD/TfdA family dioxygenase [Gammaproteobacteria bacterium]|nr:TauD/TfdA family dioxygenase [Gammaproteobacteria bacterium]
MDMVISPLSEAIGAEVQGIDLNDALAPETVAAIDRAFIDYGVLLFRKQPVSAPTLASFSAQFGKLQPHVQRAYQHPDVPEVVMMTNRKADGTFDELGARRGVMEDIARGWHSDLSYDPVPAKATLLHSVAIPSRGGNTCFTNVYRAYASLPQSVKDSLNGLKAEFRYGGHDKNPSTKLAAQALDEKARQSAVAYHPVVVQHPVTRRPAIYVNPLITTHIEGISATQSEKVLETLFAAINNPENSWEHQWSEGDTLMWDNRGGTMHTGRLDYPRNEARQFIRTTVVGQPTLAYSTASETASLHRRQEA